MRTTKIWMEAKRRFPREGFNNYAEAGFGMSVELDYQDLGHLDAILHDMWSQVTTNIRHQLHTLAGSADQQEAAKTMDLGHTGLVFSMTRPDSEDEPQVNKALANFMNSRKSVMGEELRAGVGES